MQKPKLKRIVGFVLRHFALELVLVTAMMYVVWRVMDPSVR